MLRNLIAIIFVGILCASSYANLQYGPKQSEVTGKIACGKAQHPFNRYWSKFCYLKLKKPISIDADDEEPVNVAERNIDEIQIYSIDKNIDKKINENKDRIVTVKGEIFHEHTVYHVRTLVMDVKEIQVVASGFREPTLSPSNAQKASRTKTNQGAEYTKSCYLGFGFCISYPTNFYEDDSLLDGYGLALRDSNGFILVVEDTFNVDDTIETEMQSAMKEFDKITYQAKGRGWCVISGIKGNNIIYKKTFLGGSGVSRLNIKYPESRNLYYKDIVSVISKSFKPGDID